MARYPAVGECRLEDCTNGRLNVRPLVGDGTASRLHLVVEVDGIGRSDIDLAVEAIQGLAKVALRSCLGLKRLIAKHPKHQGGLIACGFLRELCRFAVAKIDNAYLPVILLIGARDQQIREERYLCAVEIQFLLGLTAVKVSSLNWLALATVSGRAVLRGDRPA
ncbi:MULTISPECIES: hypothetical protein [unclassified Mesorhizobium]|uniref:hypothetical protein n=1 Tax=unclassified Mesorhizobium TaxID=325217 RepID=UPI000FD87EFE|nr:MULTISPECIES: hypothetical protein [unclassified Mesorhizobium]TGR23103.1 hypothetical protein EN840_21815 [Mesorhizobium sp. M8A.F.Ca.ET.197.01.1.1]TGR39189.1 hypothetical protein EN842_41860 [bacterium M00.F.Ca.ET.199.01.1.1]TGR46782.1 hypothetical protein EN841_21810 [Mesorhizobium sp. M8A.F.Ca.ET.198.01.1.1]